MRVDRRRALLSSPSSEKTAAHGDEEGKQRQDRHVGEVAGVDEAVVVGAGQTRLSDGEEAAARPEMAVDLRRQPAPR